MWQKCQIDHLMWQKCQIRHLSSNLRPFFVSTAAVHAMEMSDSTLMRVSLTRAQAALDELRAKKLLPPPAGVVRYYLVPTRIVRGNCEGEEMEADST